MLLRYSGRTMVRPYYKEGGEDSESSESGENSEIAEDSESSEQ